MLIPYGDINPRRTVPFVNYLLIGANVLGFVYMVTRPDERQVLTFFQTYSMVPANFTLLTLLSSMFLHAGPAHLAGNMLFLWIAGDNVEDRFGHWVYLIFYLCAGLVAGAAHIVSAQGAGLFVPTVGASGAISGVMGAYLVLFPTSRIKFLFWIIVIGTFTLPSWAAILAWFALQVIGGLADRDAFGGVAYWAHIGGFVYGVVMTFLLKILGLTVRRR